MAVRICHRKTHFKQSLNFILSKVVFKVNKNGYRDVKSSQVDPEIKVLEKVPQQYQVSLAV